MKKALMSTLLVSSLVLAACQNTDTESTSSSEETTTSEVASVEEETTSTLEEEEITYQYYINPNNFNVYSMDENNEEKLVLLTFDDAPYGNALDIADTLEEHGAYGLFFVNGMYLDDEGSEIVKELHERGHVIANHTETHQTLTEASEELQYEEIMTTNEKIEEITGEEVRFFRAPHGMMTDYAESVVAEENMQWVNWTFGYDWMPEYQDANALANVTLNGDDEVKLLGDGANILMHDRTWTAEALPIIMDGLEEQGFTVVDPKEISHEGEEFIESVDSENE